MAILAKTIDLLRCRDCATTFEVGQDRKPVRSLLALALDAPAANCTGWYRLKIRSPVPLERVAISAVDADGQVHDSLSMTWPDMRFGAYLRIGRAVKTINIGLALSGSERQGVTATMRRISIVEYLWHWAKRGLFGRPAAYWRYFFQPASGFAAWLDFPGPANDEPQFYHDLDERYQHWIAAHEGEKQAKLVSAVSGASPTDPKISIIMTVCDPDPAYLKKAVASVMEQTSRNWELCIADDASKRAGIRDVLAAAAKDPRVKIVYRDSRGGISAANNTALTLVTGEFVTFLDHDDRLAPRAIELCAAVLARQPDTQILYSDEDKIDRNDRRFHPFFKPDFSPELIHSCNYFNHLTVYRVRDIARAGGWRSAYDGSQDYDLALRVLDFADAARVRHISEILYHWRAVPGSTALRNDFKSHAIDAGCKSLNDTFARRAIAAAATIVHDVGFYRVRYAIAAPHPKITIIIPTRDRAADLETCVDSILAKTTYPNFSILIMDNDSADEVTHALFARYRAMPNVDVVGWPGPFNFSAINNAAAAIADGEFLCLLNNDTEVITPDWVEEMVSYAMQPGVGCVGAKLYFRNRNIQHAGVVLGIGGVAANAFQAFPGHSLGYFGRLVMASNYSAVTAACLLVRRSIYAEVAGMDEDSLTIAFNDVDFCIKVRDRGYRNVWTPFAELYHAESVSRGVEDTPEKIARFGGEVNAMRYRYAEDLERDPFYSPHLSLVTGFRINV